MANEITVNVSLQVSKGYLGHSQVPGSISVDMAGSKAAGGAQAAATGNGVAIDVGTLTSTTQGYAYFRNTSSSAGENIIIGTGTTSFVGFVELKPSETAVLRLCSTNATTITFKSTSGTPVLQYWIAEI